MIAIDTSAFARLLAGETDPASHAARAALNAGDAHLPPIVLTELLSNPWMAESTAGYVLSVPVLELHDGYWHRAASLRADLKRGGFKAQIADCLIAQSCLDHDIPLITYDLDFRHFVKAGLTLL